MGFIANFVCFAAVQKLQKLVKWEFKSGNFFWRHSVFGLFRQKTVL